MRSLAPDTTTKDMVVQFQYFQIQLAARVFCTTGLASDMERLIELVDRLGLDKNITSKKEFERLIGD